MQKIQLHAKILAMQIKFFFGISNLSTICEFGCDSLWFSLDGLHLHWLSG